MSFHDSHASRRFFAVVTIALLLSLYGRGALQAQEQPSQTADMQQMQKRLEHLEKELQDLKQQMTAAAELSKQAVPGPSIEVSTDTRQAEERSEQAKPSSSINLYGFAMLDSGYNFGTISPNWFDTERPTQLTAFAGGFGPSGSTFWGVRQTRFGVKSFTPTSVGDLKTIFEFELFGTGVDAGQTTFRLRHAWGEIGKFGAGQTWSPFMDPDVFPNSLEYWGPTGMVFFRNIQFRWMPITRGDSHLWIAAERPGASADGGVYSSRIELANVQPRFTIPDISVQAQLARSWGYLQVAAIFRRIAWQQTTPTPP